ncbi:MAG TPA: hypothetical protein VHA07_01965, partial [Devosia sp.]|nr:hypothetical protein [Devosia sp.]
MFRHQLVSETRPSIGALAGLESLNEVDVVRRLLEQHTGFRQFRVVLPGRIIWADEAGPSDLAVLASAGTLEEAVRAFEVEDRPLVLDAIEAAIREHK